MPALIGWPGGSPFGTPRLLVTGLPPVFYDVCMLSVRKCITRVHAVYGILRNGRIQGLEVLFKTIISVNNTANLFFYRATDGQDHSPRCITGERGSGRVLESHANETCPCTVCRPWPETPRLPWANLGSLPVIVNPMIGERPGRRHMPRIAITALSPGVVPHEDGHCRANHLRMVSICICQAAQQTQLEMPISLGFFPRRMVMWPLLLRPGRRSLVCRIRRAQPHFQYGIAMVTAVTAVRSQSSLVAHSKPPSFPVRFSFFPSSFPTLHSLCFHR